MKLLESNFAAGLGDRQAQEFITEWQHELCAKLERLVR
jgi:hypothetical protein